MINVDPARVVCRNYAIADYLQSQGYGETLDSFRKELDSVSSPIVVVVCGVWCVCVCVCVCVRSNLHCRS